jgi:pyruvate,water dikinase
VRPGAIQQPGLRQAAGQAGIDTISVTPDSFVAVKTNVAEAEKADN